MENLIGRMFRNILKKHSLSNLGNIGLIYRAKGDLDEALKYLEDALKILDQFNLTYGKNIIKRAIEKIKKNKSISYQ